jgi:hypothetical protein
MDPHLWYDREDGGEQWVLLQPLQATGLSAVAQVMQLAQVIGNAAALAVRTSEGKWRTITR